MNSLGVVVASSALMESSMGAITIGGATYGAAGAGVGVGATAGAGVGAATAALRGGPLPGYLSPYLKPFESLIPGSESTARFLSLARAGTMALPEMATGLGAGLLVLAAALMASFRRIRETFAGTKVVEEEYLLATSFNLRTALNNISGFVELMLSEKFEQIAPQQQEYLKDILSSSKEMNELVTAVENKNQLTIEMMTDLSFKLRTLLDGITGFAGLMLEGKAGSISSEQKEYLGYVMSSSNDILRLVHTLSERAEVNPWASVWNMFTAFFTQTQSVEAAYLTKMSFKLRTSLNNISGYAELMISEKLCPITAEQKEYLNDVLTNTNEMKAYLTHELEKNKHLSLDIMSALSFKLRTLLENISGFTGLISQEKAGQVAPELKEYLDIMMSGATEILQVVHDISNRSEAKVRDALLASTSVISFNIRSSVNNITGFAELLLSEKMSPLTVEQKEYIGDIISSAQEINEYITHEIEPSPYLPIEMLMAMSFKLRSSLDGILGFAGLIYDGKAGGLTAETKEYVGDIITSSNEILQLTDNISAHVEEKKSFPIYFHGIF